MGTDPKSVVVTIVLIVESDIIISGFLYIKDFVKFDASLCVRRVTALFITGSVRGSGSVPRSCVVC